MTKETKEALAKFLEGKMIMVGPDRYASINKAGAEYFAIEVLNFLEPTEHSKPEKLYGISVHFKNIMDMAINADSSKIINYLHDNQLYDESVQPQSPNPLDELYTLPVVKMSKEELKKLYPPSELDELEAWLKVEISKNAVNDLYTVALHDVVSKIRSLRSE